MGASVKVMLSHDYCHFEVVKSSEQELTNEQINEMRKDVQRLADEAVRQYKVAKEKSIRDMSYEKQRFEARVREIQAKEEKSRTIEEVAMLKHYNDAQWQRQFEPYDYEDENERDW